MAPTIVTSLVLGCALLGGYASLFTSHRHGYFDAVRVCTSSSTLPTDGPCALDMTASVTRSITGVAPVDDNVNLLLEFFTQGLRKDPAINGVDLEALLAFVYLATQFGGAWYIIALEGLRIGNKGSILSWTGTFGSVFQVATITVIAPIYLAIQLLGSPSTPRPNELLVDPADLNLLPFSAMVTYLVPSIGLCLSLLEVLSGEARWLAIALWQPFPLYHSTVRAVSKVFCRGNSQGSGSKAGVPSFNLRDVRRAFSRANTFMTVLTVGVHVAVMGTILASIYTDLVPAVSAQHILALTPLDKPPTLAMQSPPLSILESREIVVSFLRWDVYCTCASMLIWSAYQLRAMRGSPGLFTLGLKTLFYALVGGPIFPALMLLWERDERAIAEVERASQSAKTGKQSPGRGHNGVTSKNRR